jgi:putative phage-type endonuclease
MSADLSLLLELSRALSPAEFARAGAARAKHLRDDESRNKGESTMSAVKNRDQTRGVLRGIVSCAAEGVRLQSTSPLVPLALEILAEPEPSEAEGVAVAAPEAARPPPPLLPLHPGLTAEELVRRRATLGSSEIAAVAGVNPYASPHNVWLAKVEGVDFEGNEATQLGNLLEPSICAIYADRYGRRLRKGVYTVHPSEPWMSATPDMHIEGGGLVEAKLVGLRSMWQWGPGNSEGEESDAIPLHYLCQAQWQMAVTGETFVDVSALMGTEFRSYTIRANAEVQAQLIARGRDFWQRYVTTKTPPPVDASEGAREMLKRLYPRSGGEPIAATPRVEDLVTKLRIARAGYALAKTAKALAENELKSELKDASGAYGVGWHIRYSTTKAGTRPFCFDDHTDEKGRAA